MRRRELHKKGEWENAFGIDDIEEGEDFDETKRVDEWHQAMRIIEAEIFMLSHGVAMGNTNIFSGK